MKLLVVTQYFWPESFRINEVVDSLLVAGWEVVVLTGQPNYPEGVILPGYSAVSLRRQMRGQLAIYRVPLFPRGRATALRLVLNYLSFVAAGALFGPWLLRGQRFDAILVYAPSPVLQAIPAIWLKWIKKAKLVTWVQDLWPESLAATGFVRNKRILKILAFVVGWIYRQNDLLLVPSRAFIEPMRRLAGRTPLAYHPNPGELAIDEGTSDLPAFPQLEAGFNVVFAGNMGTVQALDTVIAAAHLLRDQVNVRFVLVGSGSRSEWLRQEVKRLSLTNVNMLGRLPPSSMPGILSQASVLLVTLVRDPIMSRTVPSKLQAYLAAGRPLIAALDGEGARIVVEAGAGIACSAEDAQSLADAVKHLYDAVPETRERMGRNALSYYERHFEPKLLTMRLMQILSDVVVKNPSAKSFSKS